MPSWKWNVVLQTAEDGVEVYSQSQGVYEIESISSILGLWENVRVADPTAEALVVRRILRFRGTHLAAFDEKTGTCGPHP